MGRFLVVRGHLYYRYRNRRTSSSPGFLTLVGSEAAGLTFETARRARRCGFHVFLVGAVGNDEAGTAILCALGEAGISTRFVTVGSVARTPIMFEILGHTPDVWYCHGETSPPAPSMEIHDYGHLFDAVVSVTEGADTLPDEIPGRIDTVEYRVTLVPASSGEDGRASMVSAEPRGAERSASVGGPSGGAGSTTGGHRELSVERVSGGIARRTDLRSIDELVDTIERERTVAVGSADGDDILHERGMNDDER